MRNQVGLVAYADRLGGSLEGLDRLLRAPLAGLFGSVHLLPFFTPYDGADAGFDPEDHTQVDLRLGTWDDVRRIGEAHETVVDVIVNHVSTRSPQFTDWVQRGDASSYAGMFLTLSAVFPAGATEEQLLQVYRPRPGLPLTPVTLRDGSRRLLWTTFTNRQADLDVRHEQTRSYLTQVIERLADSGVAMLRLDAVGYAVKTPGTSCFMTPDTFDFIDEITALARRCGVEVLVEVHSHYQRQVEIGRRVDWVYDFAVPPLVLHALFAGDSKPLRRWLDVRPHNAVTVLDTHDGIGVVDVGADANDPALAGLLEAEQLDALVERIHANSGGTSRRATGSAASNVDLYQVNCTYYDALGRDDRRYLLARLVQFFLPGIPQVYYVGLLAGSNDMALLERTGVGRDVNRHRYSDAEFADALQRPVVRALLRLIRFRNTHPAFDGDFSCPAPPDDFMGQLLQLRWRAGAEEVRLAADLRTADYTLTLTTADGELSVGDVAELPAAYDRAIAAATVGPVPRGERE
jgi:sucrose phosphorylase